MNLFRLHIVIILIAITAQATTIPEVSVVPVRFGHPLYNPDYDLTPPDSATLDVALFESVPFNETPLTSGDIYYLTAFDRSILNLEHSGDLLGNDVRFFHPDLVTLGRTVQLSSLGSGISSTRLLWHGRPFRDLRTGQAYFDLIPLHAVGGVKSVHWGALNGVTSPGAIIEFQPTDNRYDKPITALYHRDGFYDVRPVEFLHSQRLATNLYASFGGGMFASQGRFAHANQDGMTLYTDVIRTFEESGLITLSYMSDNNKVEIPFSNIVNTTRRSDMDVQWKFTPDSLTKYEITLYRVEDQVKWDSLKNYGRDVGLSLRASKGELGGYLRLNRIDGRLIGDAKYELIELESSVGYRNNFDTGSLSLSVGAYGYWLDKIRLVGTLDYQIDIPSVGHLFLQAKQAVDPHSPEMMYAEYRNGRPFNDYDPAWLMRPDLPIIGRDLPIPITRGGQVGVKRPIRIGELELSGFGSVTQNKTIWGIEGDTIVTPVGLDWLWTYGWMASWNWHNDPFRAMIGMVGTSSKSSLAQLDNYINEEPAFRLIWEAGWHRLYWDDVFETDILMSGKYYSEYDAYGPNGIEAVGGAYPLDVRFTGRIKRFTLFYGVHNWNAYPYYLVPGYKMIHKEEYWGMNWMLLN